MGQVIFLLAGLTTGETPFSTEQRVLGVGKKQNQNDSGVISLQLVGG